MFPMDFRLPVRRPSQHLLLGATLALAVAIGSTDGFAAAWAVGITTTSTCVLVVGGLLAIHTAIFWPLSIFFHVVDKTDRPACIVRHRIQATNRRCPSLSKTVRVVLRNQFVILPVLLVALGEILTLRGWTANPQLPSLSRLVFELAVQTVFALAVFYSTHRFLHRKWWLRHVHRVHHEFRTTTALASEYAHPVEFVIGNFMTLATGALVIAPHLASIYLFALMATLTFVIHHSGYALPWAPWSVPHDWHHYRFREMFGTIGVIDRWMGTDREFQTFEDGEIR